MKKNCGGCRYFQGKGHAGMCTLLEIKTSANGGYDCPDHKPKNWKENSTRKHKDKYYQEN